MINAIRRIFGREQIKGGDNMDISGALQEGKVMRDKIEQWKRIYTGQGEVVSYFDTINGTTRGRHKRRAGLYKTLVEEMARLIVGEETEIGVLGESIYSEEINKIIQDSGLLRDVSEHIEKTLAFGEVMYKLNVVSNDINIELRLPDTYEIISEENGEIESIVFFDTLKTVRGGKSYTVYETHVREKGIYRVYTEAYEGELGNFKKRIPLNNLRGYEEVEEYVELGKVDFKLYEPIRTANVNNIDIDSVRGIAMADGVVDLLEDFDTVYDQMMSEIRLSKKRIYVPENMIRNLPNLEMEVQGNSRNGRRRYKGYFDDNHEVYTLVSNTDTTNSKIEETGGEIRIKEYTDALDTILQLINNKLGYDESTVTLKDGVMPKTATEVISQDSKTYRTRTYHANRITAGYTILIEYIKKLKDYITGTQLYSDLDVNIYFGDGVIEDEKEIANREIELVNAGMQSRKRAIMKIHRVDEYEALKILEEIEEER